MKKLMLIAVNSLLGMTFVLGATMNEDFYMNNASVWVTKKTQTEDGIDVKIAVDGLTNSVESNAPALMTGGESNLRGWEKRGEWNQGQGWDKGGRGGKKHGWGGKEGKWSRINMEESKFVGYLPKDSDATVTFTCTTAEGITVKFRTTLQTLVNDGKRGTRIKAIANKTRYVLGANVVVVPVAIQVSPATDEVVNVNAYVVDFKRLEKLEEK